MRRDPTIAGVILPAAEGTETVLARTAQLLGARGLVLAGLVQECEMDPDRACCPAMFVRDLKNGTRTRISEDRGMAARGCRLDREALIEAALRVQEALDAHTGLLLINRFGKAETEGRGMLGPLQQAIEVGIPVIVGVRANYLEPWEHFHGGLATNLPPVTETIVEWAIGAVSCKAMSLSADTESFANGIQSSSDF